MAPWILLRRLLPAFLLAAPLRAQAPAAPSVTEVPARAISGELIRVDATRHALTLCSGGREYEILVEKGRTRMVSSGRDVRIEDLRTGERVYVVLREDERADHGRRVATLVKAGDSRYAVPAGESPRP